MSEETLDMKDGAVGERIDLVKAKAPPASAEDKRTAGQRRAAVMRNAKAAKRSPGPAIAPDHSERTRHRDDNASQMETVTRKSRGERTLNFFDIPQRLKKPGVDYQWVTTSVMQQPVDNGDLASFYDGGWRPVLASDMPAMRAPGDTATTIDRRGQRLHYRPMALTQEALREDYNEAVQMQRDRMEGAQGGSVRGSGGGLDNVRGVRPVPLGLDVQGEIGSYASDPLRTGRDAR